MKKVAFTGRIIGRGAPAVSAAGMLLGPTPSAGVVCEVDFMVKLLRACVWMPWRKKAKKDVVSCEKLRGAANRL